MKSSQEVRMQILLAVFAIAAVGHSFWIEPLEIPPSFPPVPTWSFRSRPNSFPPQDLRNERRQSMIRSNQARSRYRPTIRRRTYLDRTYEPYRPYRSWQSGRVYRPYQTWSSYRRYGPWSRYRPLRPAPGMFRPRLPLVLQGLPNLAVKEYRNINADKSLTLRDKRQKLFTWAKKYNRERFFNNRRKDYVKRVNTEANALLEKLPAALAKYRSIENENKTIAQLISDKKNFIRRNPDEYSLIQTLYRISQRRARDIKRRRLGVDPPKISKRVGYKKAAAKSAAMKTEVTSGKKSTVGANVRKTTVLPKDKELPQPKKSRK